MYPKITRPTLLEKLRGGDNNAWNEFYESYRSLVWLKGQDYHLTEVEQQDLLSDVMAAFFTAQGNFTYDRSKGKFSWYFRKIIVSCCIKIIKKRLPVEGNGTTQIGDDGKEKNGIDNLPEPNETDEKKWRALLLREGLKEVKKTMDSRKVQCFMRCRWYEEEPEKVANSLNISLATAYNYINEVFRELRAIVRKLNREWE